MKLRRTSAHRAWIGGLAALLGLALGIPNASWAASIDPGFDLLATPAGGAFLDLPGGRLQLMGNPLGPGNTDTIVERLTGLPDGGTGIIEAEIVALSLTSISPIPISGSFFDVFIDLDPAQHSQGRINVTTHDSGGGTFDSFFDVFVEISFVEVGNPSNTVAMRAQDRITSTDTRWSHTPTPGYPQNPGLPSGGFYLTVAGIQHSGPHPLVVPAVPEPSSLVLYALSVAAVLRYAGRRKEIA